MTTPITRRAMLAGLGAGALNAALARPAIGRGPKQVILLGQTVASHGYGSHDFKAGCDVLADALNRSEQPVRASVQLDTDLDATALRQADAVIVYSLGLDRHPFKDKPDLLRELIDRDVNLGFLHYAVVPPQTEMMKTAMLEAIGGYYETHWSVNPFWSAEFETLPAHPITQGVGPFAIHDEWYYHMRFTQHQSRITPILSALPPASTLDRPDGPHSNNPAVREAVLQRKQSQHLAWAYQRPQGGRGFGYTGLDAVWQLGHPQVFKLLLNAGLWLAGVPVPKHGVALTAPRFAQLKKAAGPPPNEWDGAQTRQKIQRWQQTP
jgi:hypothetical protein